MTLTVRQILTVLVALAVITSGAGLVLAVSTTTSTDATNVAAVDASDWADDNSTVVSGFDASAQNNTNVSFKVPTDNATSGFEITVSYDGAEHLSLDDTHASFETVATNADTDGDGTSTGNTDVHAWNFSNDKLRTVPGQPGGNTTVTVNITNYNSTDGTVIESNVFEVTLTFHENHSVIFLGAGTTAFNDVDVDKQGASFWQFRTEDADVPDHYVLETNHSVGPSGEATIYLDGDMASNYSANADEPERGELLTSMGVLVDGDLVAPYYEEPGDDVDTESDVYAVYSESDDTVTFHNLEQGNRDFTVANHDPGDFDSLGFWDIRAHESYGFWDAAAAA